MEEWKEITLEGYDRTADEYGAKREAWLYNELLEEADLFLKKLPGKKIIDIGSGPGRDSTYFKQRGFEPICTDLSKKMIKLCRKRGLDAQIMDFEKLDFPENSFDGAWAYMSLIHLPKRNLPKVLENISKILKPKGMFFLGMKKGTDEQMVESNHKKTHARFRACYLKKELEEILSKHFSTIYYRLHPISDKYGGEKRIYMSFLCENKKYD